MRRNLHRTQIGLTVLILINLVACSPAATINSNTPAATAAMQISSSPTPSATQTPEAKSSIDGIDLPTGIELDFWHPWSGSMANLMEVITETFNQTNQWGITVTAETHADEMVLLEDVNLAFASGELPDIVAAPSAYLKEWYSQDLPIQDLNAYVSSPAWGIDPVQLNAFLPVFWKSDLVEDIRLGIPAYRSGHFLFYNQSWARDLGFDEYPETNQEFETQICAAAKANLADPDLDNNGTGGWIYSTQALSLLSWLRAFSGEGLQDPEGNIIFSKQSNQAALEYIFDLYTADCAWTGKQSTPFQYFAKRFALAYSGDSQDIFTQELMDQETNNQDDWILIPYPSDNYRPVVYVDGYSYALMHETDEQTMAAWLFLRYLTETENQIKIIEATGALPLSSITINELSEFRTEHPAWNQALQYLALAQSVPDTITWIKTEPVLADMAWQLRFSALKENIPVILSEAEEIILGTNGQ